MTFVKPTQAQDPFLPRPARIRSANELLPVAYGHDVKGAPFAVNSLSDLYSLYPYRAGLEQNVSVITVLSDLDEKGNPKQFLFVDLSKNSGGVFQPDAFVEIPSPIILLDKITNLAATLPVYDSEEDLEASNLIDYQLYRTSSGFIKYKLPAPTVITLLTKQTILTRTSKISRNG